MTSLRFGHGCQRQVAHRAVRAQHHEEVRKAWKRNGLIRVRTVAPHLVGGDAVAAGQPHRPEAASDAGVGKSVMSSYTTSGSASICTVARTQGSVIR